MAGQAGGGALGIEAARKALADPKTRKRIPWERVKSGLGLCERFLELTGFAIELTASVGGMAEAGAAIEPLPEDAVAITPGRRGIAPFAFAESSLTGSLFWQILGCIEQLAWHPTSLKAPK